MLKDVGAYERFVFTLPRISILDGLLVKSGLPVNATLFLVGWMAFQVRDVKT